MPLLLDDLRDTVRAETGNTDDTQYTDTELNNWFWLEYGKLRRRLSAKFPALFETISADTTVTTADPALDKPDDFERLIRIERQAGADWQVVPHASKANPHLDWYIGFEERGNRFHLTPGASAAGVYRIVYVMAPAEVFPAADIPRGFEDVLIQRVAAKAAKKMKEDPEPFLTEARETYKDLIDAMIVARRGTAPEPGLVCGYGAGAEYSDSD